ncbi:MAG TPA: aminotransferase class I/II-fold pyridoxal phosphate-dependent enzyme [Acidimicrobiales bacterium]|nr:aminotransferase class I/II-fold pyridoxal phosphate-dependent enzyme [Acidimicrobiales bacterium]
MTDRHEELIAPRDSVRLMEGYFSPQIDVEVRLNVNEAPEPPPSGFLEAVWDLLGSVEFNRYPVREATGLREGLAALHGLSPEEIYPANGSNEVLQSLLLAYGGSGRSAAVFEPTYALHHHIASVTGTRVISGSRDADFLVDPSEIERVIKSEREEHGSGPSILFLCSPNNPTGRVETDESIAAALELAPGLVIVDEAYVQFAGRSVLDLRAKYRKLVVIRTFSKTWSLAALRLGYAIADPEVVDAAFRVTLPYHLDAFKQAAGCVALRYVEAVELRTERLVAGRRRMIDALGRLDVDVLPSDSNFVCFRPRSTPAGEVWKFLVDRSILVRDVSGYERLDGWLRVTVGTPNEVDAFLAALAAALG